MLKKYKKVTEAFQYQPGIPGSRLAELELWLRGWSKHLVSAWNTGTNDLGIDGQTVHPGDYIIRNMKDYPHVIAKADFEATYTRDSVKDFGDVNDPNLVDAPSTGLDVGFAVRWLREGRKVQRQGWNGKGMWLKLVETETYPAGNLCGHPFDTPIDVMAHVCLYTADGKWQPGWNASTPDLLATDWQVVE